VTLTVTAPPAGLSDTETAALAVATDVYEAVRQLPVVDDVTHWQRFANRLKSAAYAQTAPAFLTQLAARFGAAHTPGPALVALLELPPAEQRQILRIIRRESNALSVLVRDRRTR
jgi:hypothetical protein